MSDGSSAAPAVRPWPLLRDCVRLIGTDFARLFALAFVPALALGIFERAMAPDGGGGAILLAPVHFMVAIAAMAVLCLATIDTATGRRHGVRHYLERTARHAVPLIGISVALLIATLAGLALLVLPALYVLARYLPWLPALLFEETGWTAVARAEDLTRGFRWPLAAGLLTLILATVIPLIGLSPVFGDAAGGLLVEAAASGVTDMLFAAFTTLAWLRLREFRESVTPAGIAASAR